MQPRLYKVLFVEQFEEPYLVIKTQLLEVHPFLLVVLDELLDLAPEAWKIIRFGKDGDEGLIVNLFWSESTMEREGLTKIFVVLSIGFVEGCILLDEIPRFSSIELR